MEPQHRIGSQEEWLAASRALLADEKAHMRAGDELARKRRELPWVKVDKVYTFDTPEGRKTLAELFDGRSQLIVYHFMLGPDWEEGCVGCSFLSDHMSGILTHLVHHDVSYVTVSHAPLEKIDAFKRRMGWTFPWVSSSGSDFNFDYHVSFTPEQLASKKAFYNFTEQDVGIDEQHGHSVFYKDANGDVYHTYSCYARGDERFVNIYALLDIAPKGRNENSNLTDWVRHHDRYDDHARAACPACGSYTV
ncbi:putative dithiol-disulfide oxidoreductase (DUF899 family) [Paraburkholderia sp. RAU6.4a]|uniref:DUF899 domain-containing protein n=1 Tax=unclassified Paraburkholderia TaxID=2615204 RepID=UPI00160C5035|nr:MULTISPECIES: thioredoxin family protein [unclassified Paraburkholderia]MBB5410503.1 putative dithiol-disulfide oxidoreductase (DUF899 family) [Paraburkholderia sp. HC6.4b]MBB5452695.1 putative dithiol-disulfide oxidoreductase (DUF899 family) [Paraburkholderia sp. Kb1A]MBC8723052.1 DUF899 domain-containing protein [Paraburkholderia sp. 31.1]